MSRSLSWIDAEAVASALDRAQAPTQAPTAAPIRPRFETETPTPRPAAPSAAPIASPPPRFTAGAPLAERLRSLAVWVEAELGPERWYLADDEGLALHTAGADETQVLASVMLARAMRPMRSVFGGRRVHALTLELEGARRVHTIWIDTSVGRVALGLENPSRGTFEGLRAAADAVRAALDS